MNVKRKERGWAGHFICANRCLFHRNTLLEYNNIKIVVSTVGLMQDYHCEGFPNTVKFEPIGTNNRYFETMAFHAKKDDERYYDADVSRIVPFESYWSINKSDADDIANDMHEGVVDEIMKGLVTGNLYKSYSDE